MHIQLVTNPDAGSYSAARIEALKSAFGRAGASATVSLIGPGRQLMIEQGASLLCVAGGDGTLRHVAKTVLDSGRDIAIAGYPMGTVNLLQRETEAPSDPDAFVTHILSRRGPTTHYPVSINGEIFLGCASVGPDSLSVAGVSGGLKRRIGRAAYGLSLISQFGKWPRPKLVVSADGKQHKCEAVYVAKGRYFAGPWAIDPQARRTSPKLYVVALRDASRSRYWQFMRNVMRGRPLEARDNLIAFTCTSLTIDGDENWPVQADGDDLGPLPARITLLNQVIRVL
jgi:diacylglycerol kinase family enzyme